MPTFRTACPRNCYSTCALSVTVEDGRVVAVDPDPSNPATAGGPCLKGLSYIERIYHPDRLTCPMARQKDGTYRRMGWGEALSRIAQKLKETKERHGPKSVLFYAGSGTKGLLNGCALGFWKAFGGCTTTYGDLCWPAGLEATRLTLGDNRQSAPWDIANARLIVMWGKNPAETHIHQMRYIEDALERGAKYVVIDPRRTQSAEGADLLLQVRPGTDGALALGLAHLILKAGKHDKSFIERHVLGFEAYRDQVEAWTPERTVDVTGVPEIHLRRLAEWMGDIFPMSICGGFGMQRYTNGGQTMRLLIALCAITGNIGKKGAGWVYANLATQVFGGKDPLDFYPPEKVHLPVADPLQGGGVERRGSGLAKGQTEPRSDRERPTEKVQLPAADPVRVSISTARLGPDMLAQREPPITFAWVERGNPLNQNPATQKVREAFSKLDFCVVVDERMTETAQMADIVLPAKSLFEQTDVIGAYWHAYLQLRKKIIEPPGEVRPETEIYWELAQLLDMHEDERRAFLPEPTDVGVEAFLNRKLASLHLSLTDFEKGPVLSPGSEEVAFSDLRFTTPSGRIELYSNEAQLRWQLDPVPHYTPLLEGVSEKYPLHLLTPNTKNAIHSQFHQLKSIRNLGIEHALYMHPEDAYDRGLKGGERVRIFNDRGELYLPLRLDFGLIKGVVYAYNGLGVSDGGTVNLLSEARETDMGYGAAFHDNAVEVST